MSTSELRLAANRANAQLSTGPTTIEGKEVAKKNALRHGLLSARLFVENENSDDFDRLWIDLQDSLRPVGSIELTIVERIAIAIWRQRRLISAEAAAISLNRETAKISAGVGKELGRGYGSEVKQEELEPFDPDRISWCNTVIDEIGKLERIDTASLPTLAPMVFEQLQSEADEDEESLEKYLESQDGGLTGFVDRLLIWCKAQLREAEKRPRTLSIAAQVRERRLILPDDAIEVFSRYQTTLDNQLYKALRALRDAQEWRLKTLDTSAQPIEPDQEQAA